MYWFRDGNSLNASLWLVTMMIWWLGGWLIASHAFRLDRHERLVVGFCLGLVCHIWLANILGSWLPATGAFLGAGFLTLGLGLAFTWRSGHHWLDWQDLRAWPLLVAGVIPLLWFLQVSKGLAIFDEPKNLTIISHMALGDIPPHYYLNSQVYFRYHYGFQLFAATLMRLASLFPWSAFDLAKAIAFTFAILLAGLVGRRYTGHFLGGLTTAVVLTFAGGTRYLFKLFPAEFLRSFDPLITLQGTSVSMHVPFSQALFQSWTQDGGPPVPFPFGYLNGIFPPLVIAHAGSYILSFMIMCTLLLLVPRLHTRWAFIPLTITLAVWALTWESSYGLFAVGGAVMWLYLIWKQRQGLKALLAPEMLAIMLSAPVALLQGGTLTEVARSLVFGESYVAVGVEGVVAATGFEWRWPPAVFSAHLGALSLFSPLELLAAILELGPIVLLTPWITVWVWKRLRAGEWVFGAMLASAWIGFIAPLLLVYQSERDISRLSGHALVVWALVLTLMVWEAAPGRQKALRYAGCLCLGLSMISGLVIAWTENSATTQGVIGSELTGLDARIARDTWGKLDPDSEIFDPGLWRGAAVTGLSTRVAVGMIRLPEWRALHAAPTVAKILQAGYRYVYVDDTWWESIPPDSRASLSQTCIHVIAEYWDAERILSRRLLDLAECRAGQSP